MHASSPHISNHDYAKRLGGLAGVRAASRAVHWCGGNLFITLILCVVAAIVTAGCQTSRAQKAKTATLQRAAPIQAKVEQPTPPKNPVTATTSAPNPPRIQPPAPAVTSQPGAVIKTNQTAPAAVATAKVLPQVLPAQPALTNLPVAPDFRWKQVPNAGHYIALTFDDGPNPKNTPAMLDILKKRNIPATFFVLGQNAALYPRILERMVAEGHEIGSHAWNHISLVNQTAEERAFQVRKTNEAIERATKHQAHLIRPPYGDTTPSLNRWLTEQLKMTVVLWSVDSRDWEHRDAVSTRREILSTTKPGAIILAHDIHQTTVSAMTSILDSLIE